MPRCRAEVSSLTSLYRAGCLLLAAALLATASGCVTGIGEYFRNGLKVGPNYQKPVAAVNDQWLDAGDPRGRVHNDPPPFWDWWRVFRDPTLDQLVDTAYGQNLTLREAGYRVVEARALRGIAVGNLLPQTQVATGAYNRRLLSLGTGIQAGGGAGFPGITREFSIWNTGLQLAWEVDFWGRFRRAVEAADATLDAQVESYDAALVLLIGDVADTYIEIRTLEKRLDYANKNVESQLQTLKITEEQQKGGKIARQDLAQTQSNVAQTKALIPSISAQLRQAKNRLCVLLGMPPQNLDMLMQGTARIPIAPPDVAVGIPADLLRRRPDVRQAEREVAAQSARIGIAETDLYPAITVNGSIFIQADQFKRMFDTRAIGGNVGPSFNWNIFNYFRIRNAITVEEARFMQQLTQYQNVVLNANREAEDAIVAFLQSQEEAVQRRDSAAAALEARTLINETVIAGTANFTAVFVADLFLTQQQDLLATAEGAIAQNLVAVYRALGGGWEIRLNGPTPLEALPPREELMMPPLPEPMQPLPPGMMPLPAVPPPPGPQPAPPPGPQN